MNDEATETLRRTGSFEGSTVPKLDPFGRSIIEDWSYDAWPSGEPYDWSPARRGDKPFDQLDFHLDLGCGKLKKGRIGVDHFEAPGVDLVFDFDHMAYPSTPFNLPGGHKPTPPIEIGYLPIPNNAIKSIITHHAFEHVGEGFLRLMDECYRILEPGGLLRIITPLFPSHSAVADPDHRRYFLEGTFESFCGTPDNCWLESFSVPYTKARFEMLDKDMTPKSPDPQDWWTEKDAREIRVALKACK